MKNFTLLVAAVSVAGLSFVTSCKPDAGKPQMEIIEKSETFRGENGGSMELDYRFEYLTWWSNDDVMRAIQGAQVADFFGSAFVRTSPIDSSKAFDDAATMNYNEASAAGEHPWDGYLKLRSWTDVVNDRIVAYTVERAEYTGGAHGMETTVFSNYDLRTGAKLTLDDVFTPEGKTELLGAIRGKIVSDHGVGSWDALSTDNCYCAVDEMYVTDNFLLSATHITFVYNPYDIACYANGATKVRLALSDLAGFKKEVLQK